MHDFSCADPDKMSYKIFVDKIGEQKRNKEKVKKLAGVMEELVNEAMFDTAKKMLAESELSIEKIASICELPFEKVQELKESISVQPKGTT